MLTLPTTKAAPGMTLALPVLHPEKPGHVLLKPGCVLDAISISRLQELGVLRIGIRYMPTEFLLRYAGAQIVNAAGTLAARIADEFDRLSVGTETQPTAPTAPDSIISAASPPSPPPPPPTSHFPLPTSDSSQPPLPLHADFDCQVYVDSVRSLIQRLVDDPQAALFMHDLVDARKPVAAHAFNVGFLSLLIGLKLDGYLVPTRTRITQRRSVNIESLGVGALLHDIGMTRLPPAVVERFEATRDESDLAWRKHVLLGFNLVKGKLPATASAAVLHHHQRMDGSGFPARTRGFGPPTALRGEEIHIFSRIVGVADVFDRFRNPPCGGGGGNGGAQPTVRALRKTLELSRAGQLDPVVFKALLAVVPAFAPGSIVTLNDARKCVITGWDHTQPCSPTVNVLPKSLAAALEGRTSPTSTREDEPLGEAIDLAERRDLRIATFDGESVTEDLFDPASPTEFDLRLAYAAPLGEGWEAIAEATFAAGGKLG